LQFDASVLGSTPQPHRDDGHQERRAESKPAGHIEQLQENRTCEHGEDGPKLCRARHDAPLPPSENVRTIESVLEEPTFERGPAFARCPGGQDEKGDGRQNRDCEADDTDGESRKGSGAPKNVLCLS